MVANRRKPHPTPGVWRTRVWRNRQRGWCWRMYLSEGGTIGQCGYATEAEARRFLGAGYANYQQRASSGGADLG